jgi:succinate dehydrogenase/fumarate reductase flavoprotein subunit
MKTKSLSTDVLVIGGAGAGLRAALEACKRGAEVVLASKTPAGGLSSTQLAAGWLTRSTADSEAELFRQVVEVGGHLNNQRLAEIFAREVATVIPGLREFGVELDPMLNKWDTPEMPRMFKVLPVPEQPPGVGLVQPLRRAAEQTGVKLLDHMVVTRLLTAGGTVTGALAVHLPTAEMFVITAKATVLATGGGAAAFARHNVAPGTTGDGYALAFRAGAELVDFECISFNFPPHRLREIFALKKVPHEAFLKLGWCHYFVGGVRIDEQCRSTVDGLFAAGEVAGGVFGAARLGGAALAEIYVFGARAGRFAAERARSVARPKADEAQVRQEIGRLERMMTGGGGLSAATFNRGVRESLWRYAGLMKTERSLLKAREALLESQATIGRIKARGPDGLRDALEAQHILDTGRLLVEPSLVRQETRGMFWRVDFTKPDNDRWLKNIIVHGTMDAIRTRTEPVVMTRMRAPGIPPVGQGCFNYLPPRPAA